MLEVLLLWGYMLFVNTSVGVGVLELMYRLAGKKNKRVSFISCVMAGVVAITVYAEVYSVFSNVGMTAHLLLLFAAALSVWMYRDVFTRLIKKCKAVCFSWEGLPYVILIAGIAYFASRGIQHTDTGIYHAQAIRWYEEYGLVKGLANLQQHFGYNSAYLGYAAVFSMKWLAGRSLHGTTGFLAALLCVWALDGVKDFKKKDSNLVDVCRVGILIYTLVNAEGLMSPATDYGTMYLVLYIVTRWAQLCVEKRREAQTLDFAFLCVAVVCVATYKVSAVLLVVLALYPAVLLIRQKAWREIAVCLGAGVAVLLPFLVRNVLISGWLLYPFGAIDLFSVDWKVPLEYVQYDSDQIKVWGRCLFDVAKADVPPAAWLPVWWDAKDTYEKMLIEANLAAIVLEGFSLARLLFRREKPAWELVILHGAVFACLIGWFATAPFIRYGLAFLLEFPLLAAGSWFRRMESGPVRVLAGYCCLGTFMLLGIYWSYYVLTDMNWLKQHLRDDAYVRQQDYDRVETGEIQIGSLTVYYPLESDNISYHAFPGTAYEVMAQRSEMRGDSVEDGFRPK